MRGPGIMLATVLLASCGSDHGPAPAYPRYPPPLPVNFPSTATPIADPSMREMLITSTSGQLCAKIAGKFIAVPSAADKSVVAGRWFVQPQGCLAVRTGPQSVQIHLEGPGWEWVDQKRTEALVFEFRVQQYVYFRASVDLTATFDDIWWDPQSQVASVRLRSVADPTTSFTPLSAVNARGENPFGSLFGAVAPSVVEHKAQEAAEEMGKQRFHDSVADGLTMTYVASNGQIDMTAGRLPPGTVPPRPIPSPPGPGTPWLVNERQELHSGGVQISGPFFVPSAQPLAYLESGPWLGYAIVCADGVQSAAGALAQQQSAPVATAPVMNFLRPGQLATARIAPPRSCPWVLVTYAPSDTQGVIALFQ